MMRVAYVSHSLVATRQQLFAAALREQVTRGGVGDLYELYPAQWGRHVRRGGWFVRDPGDIVNHAYPKEAWSHLMEWGPDVILLQNEAYCHVAKQVLALGVPVVTFSWENDRIPQPHVGAAQHTFKQAAWNVFGNKAAQRIGIDNGADPARTSVLPQVGIDPTLFRPRPEDVSPSADILFLGRHDMMKGWADLAAAANGMGWNVLDGLGGGYVDYADLAEQRYWQAKILCTPSKDVAGLPREQFAPAVSVEGLMCGLPVVTTSQEAVVEWLARCPAAWFAEPGDPASLREHLVDVLEGPGKFLGMKGREWAVSKFSNDVVAKEWLLTLKRAIEVTA
jgi:glycosyltransferase involved in cell wall biosynthesis